MLNDCELNWIVSFTLQWKKLRINLGIYICWESIFKKIRFHLPLHQEQHVSQNTWILNKEMYIFIIWDSTILTYMFRAIPCYISYYLWAPSISQE